MIPSLLRSPALEEGIQRYLRELRLWNPKLGLIEARDEEILPKHIWDCLAGVPVFQAVLDELLARTSAGPPNLVPASEGFRVADLGSGAGLPGLVLSLALPRANPGVPIRWVLVEKSGRRVNFLRNCAALLPQAPIEVLAQDFEQLEPKSFDILTNRAFQTLTPETFALQSRLLVPGGWILWYKGRLDSLAEEGARLGRKVEVSSDFAQIKRLNFGTTLGAWPLVVPELDAERHIVLWRKDEEILASK